MYGTLYTVTTATTTTPTKKDPIPVGSSKYNNAIYRLIGIFNLQWSVWNFIDDLRREIHLNMIRYIGYHKIRCRNSEIDTYVSLPPLLLYRA